jgi:hypothetical protein
MQHSFTVRFRALLAVIVLPVMVVACSRATEELAVGVQPAPGEVVIHQRGATTVIDQDIQRLADATEVAFAELNIAFEEREVQSDGIEMEGRDADGQTVRVDIERERDEPLTEVEVEVTRDNITFDGARSAQVLRRILALAE